MCQHCKPPTTDQVKDFATSEYNRINEHYNKKLKDNPDDDFAARMLEINDLDRRMKELMNYVKHNYYNNY